MLLSKILNKVKVIYELLKKFKDLILNPIIYILS